MEKQNDNGSGRRSLLGEWLHIAAEKTREVNALDYQCWLETQLLQTRKDLTDATILLSKFHAEFKRGGVYDDTLIQVKELIEKIESGQ